MTTPDPVWTRLHLPRPLDDARVLALLLALASDRRSPRIVFELRADKTGLAHVVGCGPSSVHTIKRIIRDHIPHVSFQGADTRIPVSEAGALELRPRQLPLRIDNPTNTTRALLSAAAIPLKPGETIVIQIALGSRRPSHPLSQGVASTQQTWWQLLTVGHRPAGAEERTQLKVKAENTGFDAAVRVGTHGTDPARTRRLTLALHSALHTAKGVGVRMSFVHAAPTVIDQGQPPRRGALELACGELLGLLGWPLGDDDYPGIPAKHPKPLRVSPSVSSSERVFAASAAPGDGRMVGVAARDSLLHAVAYGPTSSGKSTVMEHLIAADMQAGRAVAVLDPKRQLIDSVTALVPKERLNDVVILDPTHGIGFNPLDVTGRDPDVVVDGVMSVFAGLFTDGWGPRTLDIFSGTLRTLARASAANGIQSTLADIPRMLTDTAFRRDTLQRVAADDGLQSFWAWYENQSPAAQNAATSAPLNKLRQLLLRPALSRILDQRDTAFRLRDMWKQHAIVLVPLNEALIGTGTAEMLGSLITADLWQSIQERASETRPEDRPGFVYIDEAPRFLHLPTSMADALALSRSMGVGWFLAAQFVRQFPKELRTAIDMNARTKIVFGTEYEDATHFARGSRDLSAEDFMALGRFQAYANVAAQGRPQGWALVQTLPPPKPTIRPERVVKHSLARWAAPDQSPGPVEAPTPDSAAPSPASSVPVGRKRRQT